ncbi:serine/threonine protein phosphatase 1 [Dongia mobilis]|uniref:Serine/threonine protein phosphatase 1 n=1 Tax=Dongia mobilis TaxID=578943 RepID=A0A4R6WKF9_9PROT|nr:metallophosphoesterase [Dongia mobilis]TDQ80897.1 serine/threonine protein phosphatase 1 [Dongia mobilis]
MNTETATTEWRPAPGTIDQHSFAIGDIHGMRHHFDALLSRIAHIIATESVQAPRVVLLGDYIDRGPASLSILKQILTTDLIPGAETLTLPGNHETMLATVLREEGPALEEHVENWLRWGAAAIARELGQSAESAASRPGAFVKAIRDYLGADAIRQFLTLDLAHRDTDYLFIHAGLHPLNSLRDSLACDWQSMPYNQHRHPVWCRYPFLDHNGPFDGDVVVVHGHTIQREPLVTANKIGVDTGAYEGGPLTCVELKGDRLRFHQVRLAPGGNA